MFIDTTFIPLGHVDPHEYEGGMCDIIANVKDEPLHPSPNVISILIKPPLKPHNLQPWTTIGSTGGAKAESIMPKKEAPDISNKDGGHRVFCPEEHHETIVNMMEAHLCAHPLIPGSYPSAEGINEWSVKQMYQFCFQMKMLETWAYLWENWYRKGHWELWACSCHTEIPILKTTIILES